MARPPRSDSLLAAILANEGMSEHDALKLAGLKDDKNARLKLKALQTSLTTGRSAATPAAIAAAREHAARLRSPRATAARESPPVRAEVRGPIPPGPPPPEPGMREGAEASELEPVPFWEHEVREMMVLSLLAKGRDALAWRKGMHDAREKLDEARERDAALKAARDVRSLRSPADLLRHMGVHMRALVAICPAELRAFAHAALAALPPELTP